MPDLDFGGGGGNQSAAYENAANIQAGAARETAQAQLQAARESNALIKEMYQTGRADLAPWRAQGQLAMDVYGGLLGLPSIYETQFPTVPGQEYPKSSADTAKTGTTGTTTGTGSTGNINLSGGYIFDPNKGYYVPYNQAQKQIFYQDSKGNLYPSSSITRKTSNSFIDKITGSKPTSHFVYSDEDGNETIVTLSGKSPITPTYATQTGQSGASQNKLISDYTRSIATPSNRIDATEYVKRTPGYNFQFQEGLNALDRSAASRGMLLSGAQTRGAQEYGQNFALGHYNTLMDRLASMAGIGQTTAAQGAQAGQNMAAQSAQNTMTAAQGAGQANMAGAQAIGSGYVNAANAAAQNQQSTWNNLFSLGGLALGAAKLFSDRRTKTNIGPMPKVDIGKLLPVSFDYLPEFGGGHHLGFVADDLESVLPESVMVHESGMKMVNLMPILAVLVKTVQEQAKEIDKLKGGRYVSI